jgi:hypothetical protein
MKLLSWPASRTTVPKAMDKIVWRGTGYHGLYECLQIAYVESAVFIDGELFIYTLSGSIFIPFRLVLLVIPFPLSQRYSLPYFDADSGDELETFIEREWYIVLSISPTITTNNESPIWQDNNS